MNARCKKWKYLLYLTTVSTVFVSTPISTMASDSGVSIIGSTNQRTTLNKMDSVTNTLTSFTTAGVADILDADISMNKEELIALVRSKSVQMTDTEEEEESTLVMANVNEYVNIRKEPDADSEKLGILYKDCGGQLIEKGEEWSLITSGGITGWIKNQYLYFGEDAQKIAEDVGILMAYSNTETLRVRREASLDSEVIGLLANGEAVEAIEEEGEWVSVSYEGTTGYVFAQYVDVEFDIDEAESIEVIKAREAQAAEAKAVEVKEQELVLREAVLASASELEILAALIQCEAGGESYDGQLAVGAVVMNRLRCPAYPSTITDVIYASGQFGPASNGRLTTLLASGTIKDSCLQAAQEAINGVSNVGDALYFRKAGSRDGIVIGNHVFW